MYRVLVCGDRKWDNFQVMFKVIKKVVKEYNDILIINGDCVGADKTSSQVAKILKLNLGIFPANWERYGKSAGPIRNGIMAQSNIDLCLAFHENISESKGTKNMIQTCFSKKIPYKIFNNDGKCYEEVLKYE